MKSYTKAKKMDQPKAKVRKSKVKPWAAKHRAEIKKK